MANFIESTMVNSNPFSNHRIKEIEIRSVHGQRNSRRSIAKTQPVVREISIDQVEDVFAFIGQWYNFLS